MMIDIEGQSAKYDSQFAAAHKTARLVVLAFVTSIIVYVAAGFIIAHTVTVTESNVPYGFYAATVFLALGSIVFRRTQMHRFRLESVAIRRGIEGLIKHFVKVTIISAAMAEAIGVLALAIVFFSGNDFDPVRLGVVALAITLYNYPRRADWQQAVDYFSATLPK